MSATVGDERRGLLSLLIPELLLDRMEGRRPFVLGLVKGVVDDVEMEGERCTGFIARSIS